MANMLNTSSPKALLPLVIAVITGAVGGYFLAGDNQTKGNQRHTKNELVSHNQCEEADQTQPLMHRDATAELKKTENTQTANTAVPEGIFHNEVGDDLAAAINTLQLLPELIANKQFKRIAKFKQQLLNLAKKDDIVLNELLLAFQENLTNDEMKYELLQVLGQLKHPQVEDFAQNLALSSDKNDKLTGLELLADMGIANEETMDIALNSLHDANSDPQILQSAMRAMPDMLISSERNQEILTRLEELTLHQDESVRSESLFSIAKQAKRPDQLSPLLNAIQSGSIDERISAAMAIEKSTVTGDNLKRVLLNEVQNSQSLPEVRAMAASSLNRFDLTSSEIRLLESYRKSISWNAG